MLAALYAQTTGMFKG